MATLPVLRVACHTIQRQYIVRSVQQTIQMHAMVKEIYFQNEVLYKYILIKFFFFIQGDSKKQITDLILVKI